MAKLGSDKHPAVVRVQTEQRATQVVRLCDEHGWKVIAGIEPDKPEDISDVERLLRASAGKPRAPRAAPKISPNDYCPCGSEKKFKNCCGRTPA